jgi:hypothetical protein
MMPSIALSVIVVPVGSWAHFPAIAATLAACIGIGWFLCALWGRR